MKSLTVSVIIPAYNEEKNIDEIILRTNTSMETTGIPFEIIVIDDGSTDRTRLFAKRNKATVLGNGKNMGKGYSLRKGFNNATGNIIVTMDSDGSHQPEEIPKLLKPLMLNSVDVVSGSRFIGSREIIPTKRLHVLGNSIFNLLILLLTKKRITDSQTGFRAFKKRVIDEIKITSQGYEVETEFLMKTLKNGYIVQEESITCKKRKNGHSHVNPLYDGLKILENIFIASIPAQKH